MPDSRVSTGFRHALRLAIAEDHALSERAFAAFEAAPSSYLAWFLCSHRSALGALRGQGALSACAVLDDLLTRLDSDLAAIGAKAVAIPCAVSLDCLARDYLVLGSRLGTEVLRRRLMSLAPELHMPSYFSTGPVGEKWAAHCAELDRIDPASARAHRIVADAKRGFRLFAQAATLQNTPATACEIAQA